MLKAKYNEVNRCPVCGSTNITRYYCTSLEEFADEGFERDVECKDCNAQWREWFELKFAGKRDINDKHNNKYEDVQIKYTEEQAMRKEEFNDIMQEIIKRIESYKNDIELHPIDPDWNYITGIINGADAAIYIAKSIKNATNISKK